MFAKCIAINYTFSRILQGLVKGRKKQLPYLPIWSFFFWQAWFLLYKNPPAGGLHRGFTPMTPKQTQHDLAANRQPSLCKIIRPIRDWSALAFGVRKGGYSHPHNLVDWGSASPPQHVRNRLRRSASAAPPDDGVLGVIGACPYLKGVLGVTQKAGNGLLGVRSAPPGHYLTRSE